MKFHPTTLKDAWLIELEERGDERGFFARSMCRDEFAAHGIAGDFCQQNMSRSAQTGTVRGMHFQRAPYTEAKLIRCVRGAIIDVIVDLRRDSPTYLKSEAFVLDEGNRRQLYVPPGFAHGFQTLVDDIEVTYLVSAPYTPEAEGGLRYDDPALRIKWPLIATSVSPKDAAWPLIDRAAPPAL